MSCKTELEVKHKDEKMEIEKHQKEQCCVKGQDITFSVHFMKEYGSKPNAAWSFKNKSITTSERVKTFLIVIDRVPETWLSGFGSAMEKWVMAWASLTRLFYSFCQIFGRFDDFPNFEKIIKYAKHLAKSEENPCST